MATRPVLNIFVLVAILTTRICAQELVFEVLEESSPSLLGNVAEEANLTSLFGQQSLNSLQYAVVDNDGQKHSLLSVDQMSGDLSTKTILNREQMCGREEICSVTGKVVVQSSIPASAFSVELTVVIHVLDINDNTPIFPQSTFELSISESEEFGTTFLLPFAVDEDSTEQNRVNYYALEPPLEDFDLSFSVQNGSSGETHSAVTLTLTWLLDREWEELYTTTLVAYDGGNPPRNASLQLIIHVEDENDNVPRFEQSVYSAVVMEEAEVGSEVLAVRARDQDEGNNARISYFLSNDTAGTTQSFFSVDRDSGVITLKSSIRYHAGDTFQFEVIARDNGVPRLSGKCRVHIIVLDTHNDIPEITFYYMGCAGYGIAQISELAPPGYVAAYVKVSDSDYGRMGEVTCRLDNPSFNLLEMFSYEYKIVVAEMLDRERVASYTLTVACVDGGDPRLISESTIELVLGDANDNSPKFSSYSYSFFVSKNDVDTWVGQVMARDADSGANADLNYSIQDNEDVFSINSATGDIYMIRSLDKEAKSEYVFNVIAYDMSSSPLTATTTVTVNVRD